MYGDLATMKIASIRWLIKEHGLNPVPADYVPTQGVLDHINAVEVLDLGIGDRPTNDFIAVGDEYHRVYVLFADAEKVADIEAAIQSALDTQARSMGYDSIHTAVTYADEPAVVKFQTEGQALRAWRSTIWDAAYKILADWQASLIPEPTKSEVLAAMPSYTGP